MKMPDFFIIGAPKCGTTALHTYLAHHPEIYMSPKEMLFFGRDLFRLPHQRYDNLDAYLEFFKDCNEFQTAGESSVWYLSSETAAAEIHAFNPNAKIIAMFRNPIEMLPSLHSHLHYLALEPLGTLEAALDAEEQRARGKCLSGDVHPHYLQYSRAIRFGEQLDRYLEAFGRDRVLAVIFDDFRADVPATYRRVLEFLNVDTEFAPGFQPVNTNKEVRFSYLRDLLFAPSPWAQRIVFGLLRNARARRFAVDLVAQLNEALNARHVKLTPPSRETEQRIRNLMRPEVERLGVCLGRDLSAWTGDADVATGNG